MDNMLDELVLIITKTIKITTNYADKNMSDESMLITLTIAFTNIANKTLNLRSSKCCKNKNILHKMTLVQCDVCYITHRVQMWCCQNLEVQVNIRRCTEKYHN